MSTVAIVLLVAAAVLLVAAEWSRFTSSSSRSPGTLKLKRQRRRRETARPKLELVRPESEEFARSVERDLAALPTIDEHDVKRRSR
jgi:hypothetical protein